MRTLTNGPTPPSTTDEGPDHLDRLESTFFLVVPFFLITGIVLVLSVAGVLLVWGLMW